MESAVQIEVYPGYTQAELDRAYSQRDWAANAEDIMARWARSAKANKAQGCAEFRYGEGADELIDVYPAPEPGSYVHFHIHGGAWRAQSKEDCAFLAPIMRHAGVTFVVPEFGKLPQVRMPDVFRQLVRALTWTYDHHVKAGPARKILISGHSSGGHMAALLAAYDWASVGIDKSVFLDVLCISGPYDLEPVLLSSRRDYIELDAEEAVLLSPIRHVEKMCVPLHLLYGTAESPEFIRHSLAFAAALQKQGKLADCTVVPGVNHFEIIDRMADPATEVGKYFLRLLAPDDAGHAKSEVVA